MVPVIKSSWAIRLCKMLECYVTLESIVVDAEFDPPEEIRGRVAITYSCHTSIIFVSACINFTHRLE